MRTAQGVPTLGDAGGKGARGRARPFSEFSPIISRSQSASLCIRFRCSERCSPDLIFCRSIAPVSREWHSPRIDARHDSEGSESVWTIAVVTPRPKKVQTSHMSM